MKMAEAEDLGARVSGSLLAGDVAGAYLLLAPTLAARTPFPVLQRIGETIGAGPLPEVDSFVDRIASEETMGGWVVIGGALQAQLDRDLSGALARCRTYTIAADVWYGADILGERVPGPALLVDFEATLKRLAPWRIDDNRWVRRSVGVAVHFWAKRAHGARELTDRAHSLLDFLEPMFGERETDAIKGIGWGIKTIGQYYPETTTDWLVGQVAVRRRPHRALVLRKSVTYLSEEQRSRVMGDG